MYRCYYAYIDSKFVTEVTFMKKEENKIENKKDLNAPNYNDKKLSDAENEKVVGGSITKKVNDLQIKL